MGEIIKSLKEFIWDIVGYIIPGFLLIIILNLVILPKVGISNDFLIDWDFFGPYLIVVLSYVIGFVVYSLTLFKIRIQDDLITRLKLLFKSKFKKLANELIYKKHSRYWKETFEKSETIIEAKAFLSKNGYERANEMEINELRNIFMSRNPEMDQKVYTFMFRSSVFDHISTILILLVILALVQLILSRFDMYFMKTESTMIAFYVLAIFLIPLLGNCKRMFYGISQRIPFSNLK